jgi:serine/threonine protein kinase
MDGVTRFLAEIFCFESPQNIVATPFTQSSPKKFHDIYELGDVIGEGGNAVVRMATNIKTNKNVAVKIAKRADLDPRRESAMKREFDILQSLQHSNVVQAIGLFEESQNYYFVLEYMKGGELFDRIVRKTQYSEKEARDAVRCILSAVEYFHNHDIVHRDLKPENILLESLDDDTTIKVADFGLARTIDGHELMSKAGTPEYWAPEIVESKLCGKAMDMWAVGVIAFVLLGGYTPFHSRNRSVLLENIRKAEVIFNPKRWNGVSESAKSFIRALLRYEPNERVTATDALKHPWIAANDDVLAQQNLTDSLEEFRKYNSARKFRTGVRVLTAINKFKRSLSPRSAQATTSSNDEPSSEEEQQTSQESDET